MKSRKAAIGQHPHVFRKKVTRTIGYRYWLFLPKGYGQSKKRWPLMLFLHGAGERGKDLQRVKTHGPPKIVDAKPDFPFILVSPQCPENTWWSAETLTALLDEIIRTYAVDEDRVYLTGLSMGGFGTWVLASEHPERFAAIAPICGGGLRIFAFLLKDVPVWAFHGAKDDVVPLDESERMVKAVKKHGGEGKLTVYPKAGHDSWTKTYANPALYRWFLKHRRTRK